ncbi:IDLSRF-like peptide, partial [Fragariocoptes setiger]
MGHGLNIRHCSIVAVVLLITSSRCAHHVSLTGAHSIRGYTIDLSDNALMASNSIGVAAETPLSSAFDELRNSLRVHNLRNATGNIFDHRRQSIKRAAEPKACHPTKPFRCPGSDADVGQCIPIQYLCDGASDCPTFNGFPGGYDEDPRLCTAVKRPPVEETRDFLKGLLNSHGPSYVEKLFGPKIKQALIPLGGPERVAIALSMSKTIEDFGKVLHLMRADVDHLRDVLTAIRNTDGSMLRSLGVVRSSEMADLRFFLEHVIFALNNDDRSSNSRVNVKPIVVSVVAVIMADEYFYLLLKRSIHTEEMVKLGRLRLPHMDILSVRCVTYASVAIFVATVLITLAFSTPYWLNSTSHPNQRFRRLGLWEACFINLDDVHHRYDRRLSGCRWIFDEDYSFLMDLLEPHRNFVVKFKSPRSIVASVHVNRPGSSVRNVPSPPPKPHVEQLVRHQYQQSQSNQSHRQPQQHITPATKAKFGVSSTINNNATQTSSKVVASPASQAEGYDGKSSERMASHGRQWSNLTKTIVAILIPTVAFLSYAFFSTEWLASESRYYGAKFNKLGLWRICFRSFSAPNDFEFRKFYVGCRWVFAEEYRNIRHIIFP